MIFTCPTCQARVVTASAHDDSQQNATCGHCGTIIPASMGIRLPPTEIPSSLRAVKAETRQRLLALAEVNKIAAVKEAMAVAGCGLAEAKAWVDAGAPIDG